MTIDTHLNECPDQEANELRALVSQLRSLPEQEPSPEFHAQTMALLPHDSEVGGQTLWRKPWIGIGVAAAAGLALLLSGLYLTSLGTAASSDIQWLLAQQEADGTWDPSRHGGNEQFRPALTALAILALDRTSPPAAASMGKATDALGRLQNAEGLFTGGDAQASAYNLAMTTFALASCASRTPDTDRMVARAVAAIKASQLPNGSWDYAPAPEGNIAITTWMVRALKSAELCKVGDSSIAQRKALRWLLRNATQPEGAVQYKPAVLASDTLTALTAISFITAGQGFPDLQSSAQQMTNWLARRQSDGKSRDCYRDYATIEAFKLAGQPALALRTQEQMERLRQGQDTWSIAGGKLYTTAFTALSK